MEYVTLPFKMWEVWGFPGGPVVKNLPGNVGDTRFEPWSMRIPHVMG